MNMEGQAVRLHDSLTCIGWVAGAEANALAYWSMRFADEIEGVGRYLVAYRALRELAWNHVRAFGVGQNAVSSGYAGHVAEFMRRHEVRFPQRYRQTLDEIHRAIRSMSEVPVITGRTAMHYEAMAA